jgi:hypothetical protein
MRGNLLRMLQLASIFEILRNPSGSKGVLVQQLVKTEALSL